MPIVAVLLDPWDELQPRGPAAVRAWAAGQGIEVNARGRIKADVVEKFRAAGN